MGIRGPTYICALYKYSLCRTPEPDTTDYRPFATGVPRPGVRDSYSFSAQSCEVPLSFPRSSLSSCGSEPVTSVSLTGVFRTARETPTPYSGCASPVGVGPVCRSTVVNAEVTTGTSGDCRLRGDGPTRRPLNPSGRVPGRVPRHKRHIT